MRTMACKQCGRPFEALGGKDTYLCPDCSTKYFRAASVRDRTCRQCGKVFSGGPRAWYCPDCRRERQREADRRHKKNGTARPIGSTDLCKRCGKEYIVNSARQMYCPECSKIAVPEKTRQQSREYNAAHRETLAQNKAESRKGRNVCVICGAIYDATSPAVTCSPECAKKLRKLRQDEKDIRRGRRKLPAGVSYDSGLPKSGIVGVTASRSGKWRAAYKGKYLGTFQSIPDAAAAIEKYKEENKK